MKAKYSSYEEIERDLKILKIERELHFHKAFQSLDSLKEEFSPINLIRNAFSGAFSAFKGSGGIQTFLITSLFKFVFRKIFRK